MRYYYIKTAGIKMLQLAVQITIKMNLDLPWASLSEMNRRATVCKTKARIGSVSDNTAVKFAFTSISRAL